MNAASNNLVYRLVSKAGDNPLLRVMSNTGEIFTTSNRIDREKLCPGPSFEDTECSFEIEVVILPNDYFRLIKIKIIVKDTNDNAPMFPSPVINISIPENTLINSRFAIPSATDPDTGPNSVHKYELVNGQSTFGLDIVETQEGEKWPQLIVQQNLDREQKDTYVMKIKVEDGGNPQKSSTAILQVTVTDVNDNRPVFKENLRYIISPTNGTVMLSEKDPINTKIALITVSDKDTDVNGKEYIFKIVASDSGKPSLNQTALVKVKLEDENDNPPIFSQPVIELATDEDSGRNAEIVYQLGPNASFFDLDRKTGVLTASRVFDREDQDRFLFTVTARDNGTRALQSQAAVIVTILDENDNSPKFTHNHFQFFVSENLPKYSTVGVITVTDADAGENAEVSLSILNDNENFILDPFSGVIKSNVSFDREQQSSYTFDVRAVDGGRPPCSSVAKVTINVIDVNDNPPIVIYPPSNTSFKLVPLSAIPGSVVAEVFAVDGDTGMNAELKYTIISGNGRGLFRIDPVTGNITLEEKPTVADIGLHRLVVNISDLGYPKSLHTLVLVFLYINDTVGNSSFIYDLIRRTMETPLDRNIGESSETYQNVDNLKTIIAIVTGAMVVIVVIFITVLVRCRHVSQFKAAQRKKQGAEWMSPNQENKQNKKKKRKKRKSPKSSLLNFVSIEENKPDDPAHEPINGTISIPAELEEPGIGRFDWNTTPTTTFKPNSPDLARHYKSASPQSAFHVKADTPVSVKKHHVVQELPLDNTFVGGCDTLSKRSSTSSDHFSASECSSQGGFKTKGGTLHNRQCIQLSMLLMANEGLNAWQIDNGIHRSNRKKKMTELWFSRRRILEFGVYSLRSNEVIDTYIVARFSGHWWLSVSNLVPLSEYYVSCENLHFFTPFHPYPFLSTPFAKQNLVCLVVKVLDYLSEFKSQGTLTRARTELNPDYLDLRSRTDLNPEYWKPPVRH
ncbi:hypothetical protein QTP70_005254 [Hemibagrus guttatus]|uniref:Cadherin domain-containing protein n=1 Tax=Hemibagrus guttatus TaxID=175788 RepID=A0AAE0RIR2_9TELE|nr:hypothetical protein QTP70_005254 [Hemibagrus guttatus]